MPDLELIWLNSTCMTNCSYKMEVCNAITYLWFVGFYMKQSVYISVSYCMFNKCSLALFIDLNCFFFLFVFFATTMLDIFAEAWNIFWGKTGAFDVVFSPKPSMITHLMPVSILAFFAFSWGSRASFFRLKKIKINKNKRIKYRKFSIFLHKPQHMMGNTIIQLCGRLNFDIWCNNRTVKVRYHTDFTRPHPCLQSESPSLSLVSWSSSLTDWSTTWLFALLSLLLVRTFMLYHGAVLYLLSLMVIQPVSIPLPVKLHILILRLWKINKIKWQITCFDFEYFEERMSNPTATCAQCPLHVFLLSCV